MADILRTRDLPLPKTKQGLITLIKQMLDLRRLEEIRITPDTISVSRFIDDAINEEILPRAQAEEVETEAIDADFLLTRIALHHLPFDPAAHPFLNIREATATITARGLRPGWILAPEGGWVEAYCDLPEEPPASHVFGMKVVYSDSQDHAEKLVVVGSPTAYLHDAQFGVIIDLGA
jgi:hypothetical protein